MNIINTVLISLLGKWAIVWWPNMSYTRRFHFEQLHIFLIGCLTVEFHPSQDFSKSYPYTIRFHQTQNDSHALLTREFKGRIISSIHFTVLDLMIRITDDRWFYPKKRKNWWLMRLSLDRLIIFSGSFYLVVGPVSRTFMPVVRPFLDYSRKIPTIQKLQCYM